MIRKMKRLIMSGMVLIGSYWLVDHFILKEESLTLAEKTEEKANKTNFESLGITSNRLDVPLLNQMEEPSLYNGCEVTSLAMILNYYGNNVSKNELAESIAKVSYYDEKGNYGNPNEGFVGDIYGNEIGYSVYHGPIVDLAKQYTETIQEVIDLTEENFTAILEQVAAGNPVWTITTVPMAETNDMEEWQTEMGTVEISWNVHSVVITGFDEEHVYVNDPYGEKDKEVNREDFKAAWEQRGSQAVVINEIKNG